MSEHKKATLFKYKSWSPEIQHEEAWLKRRQSHRMRLAADRRSMSLISDDHHRSMTLTAANRRHSMSVTDEDLEELRACFELGFGFDSNSDLDPKLTKAFPALELYQAVNKLSRSSSSVSTVTSECDDAKAVKMRLKQWAQVVALSVRRSPSF
ncbi:hypothetical protein RND71_041692 [Anisodus tanguticus]|uniref:Uncharacterized protein n=1 Tax=Anisodus tanguticus TaxID=243964 RepID=A0AAE1QV87_9SOLA|nr:hypothetical protein RND71_041692 [Anisodus tanguticus]